MQGDQLRELLHARITGEQAQWLESMAAHRGERLLAAFVGAARRLGNERLGGDSPQKDWPLSTLARVAMVLSMDADTRADGDTEAFEWIVRAYREGDSGEKRAIVAALPWLRDGKHYLELALDAGRTNETELFCALAIDNAFPELHYPQASFNSLVMKAAQLDLPLERMLGLVARANADLARMAMEYIDERQSAGRAFPASLWLAIAPISPPGAVARMLGELQHSVPARRLGAVHGLALCRDARAISFLRERLAQEASPEIKAAIEAALVHESL